MDSSLGCSPASPRLPDGSDLDAPTRALIAGQMRLAKAALGDVRLFVALSNDTIAEPALSPADTALVQALVRLGATADLFGTRHSRSHPALAGIESPDRAVIGRRLGLDGGVSAVLGVIAAPRRCGLAGARAVFDSLAETVAAALTLSRRQASLQAEAVESRQWRSMMSTMLDCLPYPVWVVDADMRYAFQNRHDREAFQDLIGKTAAQSGLPDAMVKDWVALHKRVLAGETVVYTSEKTAQGRTIIAETTMAPILFNGRPQALIGLSIDQTERTRAEQAQRTSQALLQDYLETSSDWLWESDREHRLVQLRQYHGQGREDLLGRTRWDIAGIDPDQAPNWQALRATMDAHRPIRDFVYRVNTREGDPVWMEINGKPIFDATGRFLGYRGTSRDVSAREQVTQYLKRVELVVGLTQNVIIICGRDRRIEWVNPAFETLTGYSFAEAEGRTPGELLQFEGTDPATVAQLSRSLEAGQGIRVEIQNRAKTGRTYWIDLDIRPMRDGQGAISGFVAVQSDISEIHAMRQRLAAIFDNVPACIAVHDAEGTIIDGNRELERTTGIPLNELIGFNPLSPDWIGYQEDGSPYPGSEHPAFLALKADHSIRGTLIGTPNRQTGALRWFKGNARAVDLGGSAGRIAISSFADVTQEMEHERELKLAREKAEQALAELSAYKAALDQHSVVSMTDLEGRITYVNDLFCAVSQYSRDELIGQPHNIINSGYHPKSFFSEMWQTISRGRNWHGEVCNKAKDGTRYWVDTTVMPLSDSSGRVTSYVSIRYDISERKSAEDALRAEIERRTRTQALLRDVIDTIPDAVSAYDPDDRLAIFNAANRAYYPLEAPLYAEGNRFEDIIRFGVAAGQYEDAGDTPEEQDAWLRQRLGAHRDPAGSHIQKLPDGRWLQVSERRSPSGYTVGVRTDITNLKLAEATIKLQAEQDGLTGLANRQVLFDHLQAILAGRRRAEPMSGCLVLLDMDHFKAINDTLGHDAGDTMLRAVADRLRASTRAQDTIARLGGDEFGVILAGIRSHVECAAVVNQIQAALSELITISGRTLQPHFSIGVTLFPQDSSDPNTLFKNADIALYEAKTQGRARWCFFDPTMKESLERRQSLTADLRAAIGADHLTIALQPQLRFSSGRHDGFEALVRWSLNGRMVSPGEFIPLAEETGLIVPLGSIVLRKSLAALRDMLDQGFEPGQVAVNVAALQLKSEGFVDEVAGQLERYGLEPWRLELEITETVLLDRSGERIEATLQGLHQLGVTLALDDFGTGYASLTHLKRFHVDRLKIDQSFVRDIGADPDDAAIVRAIINLAHSLDLEVVAEGIETPAQAEFLHLHGCDIAQGYLYARPLDAAGVKAYIAGIHGTARAFEHAPRTGASLRELQQTLRGAFAEGREVEVIVGEERKAC